MLLGTLRGIIVAIVLSLFALAYQVADPPVHVLRRKPGTNVFRPRRWSIRKTRLSRACCCCGWTEDFLRERQHIAQKMKPLVDEAKPTIVVLDLSGVPDIEYTALTTSTKPRRDSVNAEYHCGRWG